eukprot:scaffold8189_cov107-Skeletonema_dohrnii-CCMP3373.AAC.11
MPTAIEALAKDGSGGGELTGELREHELCTFSYDSSDEPTEVIVLLKKDAGDESSKQERAGVSKSIDPLLNGSGSDSSSAPPVMDNNSPPPKNMTKRDFGLTDDNNIAKLTRQHVIQGAGSKENASPQKEANTRTFAPLDCTQTALFGNGGGSNNPTSRTLMNDIKDTSGNIVTTAEKASTEGVGTVVGEEPYKARDAATQAIKARAPKEGDGELFRSVKARGNATDMLMEKTSFDESISGDNRQGRKLDEVKSALSKHTSAILTLFHQTAVKGEKCVPASLVDPVREETMAALRNAHFHLPLSGALSEAENDAVRLYTEEIRQREKESRQQQREQRLETKNDGSVDNEGQCGTKSVFTSSSVNNDDLLAGVTSKRPRSDKEGESLQVKKRPFVTYRYSSEGCTNNAVKRGVCGTHRAKVKQCSSEGCTNHAKKGGVCWRHGAKAYVKLCSSEGCTNHVQKGGVCIRHGAKVKLKLCSSEGCTNNAVKGGVCMKHGAKVKLCSSEGCTNIVQKGGLCVRHGAKVKLCSREGCTNRAVQGGVCIRHGATQAARKLCSREGCSKQAKKGGVCMRHGRNDLP